MMSNVFATLIYDDFVPPRSLSQTFYLLQLVSLFSWCRKLVLKLML